MPPLTRTLTKNMVAAAKMSNDTAREMEAVGRLAVKRHDRLAEQIKALEVRLDKDPENPNLIRRHQELLELKNGMLAAVEYAEGTVEQHRGERPRRIVPKHTTRDHQGQFTQKGSYRHFLGGLLRKPTRR